MSSCRGVPPIVLAAVLFCDPAGASGGTALGEGSRVAALAGAVSAAPGDPTTIYANPAGIADVRAPALTLSSHVARLDQTFARDAEPESDRSRTLAGFGVALATPFPGVLRPLHFGMAVYAPAQHLLKVSVPERGDEPASPIYDGRSERVSGTFGLALEAMPELKLGVAMTLVPSFDTPTDVGFRPGRGESTEDDVIVDLERDLRIGWAPIFGLRAVPLDWLGLGLVYRAAVVGHARGTQRTVAGGILADDPIDYFQFWDPARLSFGVWLRPRSNLGVSLDAGWERWSEFRDAYDQPVRPAFRNTLNLALGAEWEPFAGYRARAGVGFEPTPLAAQVSSYNYLDADRWVLGLGGGVNLDELTGAPLMVDVHLRTHLGRRQHATKELAALPDADPDSAGQQVDNLGFPGFSSRTNLYQAGLSLTLLIGNEERR